MKTVQLLCAKNVISRLGDSAQQEIEFLILIENIAYSKEVEVVWAEQDGIWRTTKAEFHSAAGQNLEVWRAKLSFRAHPNGSLPGNIRFALRYRVLGREYWDNNSSRDYGIEADSGILVQEQLSVVNIDLVPSLGIGQRIYDVTVAVRHSLSPRLVDIVWTTDRWTTQNRSSCYFHKDFWYQRSRSKAGNPNRYGWDIWSGQIGVGHAYGVEYAIVCDTDVGRVWDNNFGKNYLVHREPLRILTLNLHCYQEDDQQAKFAEIARAIKELNVDIVCFQEVGEYWNEGRGDWNSNAAKIICDITRRSYDLPCHLYADRSHIGFARFYEGTAIISRYRFLAKESDYVSNSHDVYNIHTRKVPMVQVHVPYIGFVNIFSVHLSWWHHGFWEQFQNLKKYAAAKHGADVAATLLCGDFNVTPGSEGYALITNGQDYEDQFLKASSRHVPQRLAENHRIDYIFTRKNDSLTATAARALFTGEAYRRVSDHYGYYMEFEPH